MSPCTAGPMRAMGLIVPVLLSAAAAEATTYYVRTSGDDGNSGTSPGQAWQTVDEATTNGSVAPGDVVYVGAGTYTDRLQPSVDGTAADPVRFIADVSGVHTGDPGNCIISSSDAGRPVLELKNDDYLHFLGFTISGGEYGATLQNSTGCLLQDCQITGGASGGVNPANNSLLTVSGCHVHHTSGAGLDLGNQAQVTVTDCNLHDHAGHGIDVGQSNTLSVDASTIAGNAADGIYTTAANSSVTVTRSIIDGNGGNGIGANKSTVTAINCLITDNTWEGILADADDATSVTVFNCTLAANRDGLLQVGGTVTVTNSILASNTQDGLDRQGGTMDHSYNLLFDNAASDYNGTTAGTAELLADPLFVDPWLGDYHLGDGSPAINSGTDAAGMADDDLEGNARPIGTRWDMGCYEMPSGAGSSGGWRIIQWTEIGKPGG